MTLLCSKMPLIAVAITPPLRHVPDPSGTRILSAGPDSRIPRPLPQRAYTDRKAQAQVTQNALEIFFPISRPEVTFLPRVGARTVTRQADSRDRRIGPVAAR